MIKVKQNLRKEVAIAICLAGSMLMFFACNQTARETKNAERRDVESKDAVSANAVNSISLDTTAITLLVDEEYTLKATVLPENVANNVSWISSKSAVARVTDGKVIGLSPGETTITVEAGNKSATCKVKVILVYPDEFGVVINGVKWATRNVGESGTFVANPENYGNYYTWNNANAGNICPKGWRVPTPGEIKKLLDNDKVKNEWKTIKGVKGIKFTDKTTGKSIFLPAAGMRTGFIGSSGFYWTNEATPVGSVSNLTFIVNETVYSSVGFPDNESSVRCVAGEYTYFKSEVISKK